MKYHSTSQSFRRIRKRLAVKLQNPRLLNISFKSFRHWGGSMIAYHTNGNVLTVKKMLRHKAVENTMKYIHTVNFREKDFEVAVAAMPEDIQKLGKEGWIKYDEMTFNGKAMRFYRKPKRFGGLQ
jgi:integrase